MMAWIAALLASSALAAPAGWRWDGTAHTSGTASTWFTSPAWSTPLPATGSGSPVVVGGQVCGTAEPTRLWCSSASTGRMLWSKDNGWIETVPLADRPAATARLAAGEAAVTALAEVQAEYSRLQRDARRTAADPATFAKLEQLSARMDELKRTAADIKALRTPADRGIMGWASATPVSDGSSIYAVFANGVVSRFSMTGERLWSVWLGPHEQEMNGYSWGSTSSPVLADGVLVVPYGALHGLDAATGAVRWSNGVWLDYGSPALARPGGVPVIVTPDGRVVDAHSGVDLARGLGSLWYGSPVVDGDRAYWVGSSNDAHVRLVGGITARAVQLDASAGAVRATPLWTVELPIAERFYATPLVVGGLLYQVSNERTMVALRADDGGVAWLYSLSASLRGETWASPVAVGDVIYVASDLGEVLALRASANFEALGVSTVGPMLATPAYSGSRLVFRTFRELVAY